MDGCIRLVFNLIDDWCTSTNLYIVFRLHRSICSILHSDHRYILDNSKWLTPAQRFASTPWVVWLRCFWPAETRGHKQNYSRKLKAPSLWKLTWSKGGRSKQRVLAVVATLARQGLTEASNKASHVPLCSESWQDMYLIVVLTARNLTLAEPVKNRTDSLFLNSCRSRGKHPNLCSSWNHQWEAPPGSLSEALRTLSGDAFMASGTCHKAGWKSLVEKPTHRRPTDYPYWSMRS